MRRSQATMGSIWVFVTRHRLDAAAVAAIAVVSFAALDPAHKAMLAAPWMDGFAAVLPETSVAALRVWVFWGLAAALTGGAMLRISPSLGLVDAMLGGFVGVWLLAFLGANALGPIGLFRSATLWLAMLGAAVWLRPRARGFGLAALPRPLAPGEWLVLLAFALAAPGMLLLQLGSPVPPHMDTMAPPAAAQRIVTFGTYLPFDNDPFGYWDAASQCPGVETFYALLALGGGTRLAILAETASMVPMFGVFLLAIHRLGRSIAGATAGGMAALLIFATVYVRSFPYGHGRFVTFVLVSAGLAWFLDRARNPVRLVLAALTLGTAVASHAVLGAFGMAAAAGTVLVWLLSGELRHAVAGAGLLASASLVAFPSIAVGLRLALPYPVLPLVQLLGCVLAIAAARLAPSGAPGVRGFGRVLLALVSLEVVGAMLWHPTALPAVHDHWVQSRFPTLFVLGGLGVVYLFVADLRARAQLAPVAMGLGIGFTAEYLSANWWTTFADPNVQVAVEGFARKADYWHPFLLVVPAACVVAGLAERVSLRVTVWALLAVLFFPWNKFGDPNYYQHSVAEGFAYQVELAKGGYWAQTGDRRWTQTPTELELSELLRKEVRAGRIGLETHVVHVTPYVYLFMDTVLFSVFTGINDDLYVAGFVFDRATAGGRFYPADKLAARLEERPPYVVLHDVTRDGRKIADKLPELPSLLREYEVLLDRDGVRLLRHPRILAEANPGAT